MVKENNDVIKIDKCSEKLTRTFEILSPLPLDVNTHIIESQNASKITVGVCCEIHMKLIK